MNELMNKLINELMNELINELMNEWMNCFMNSWLNDWMVSLYDTAGNLEPGIEADLHKPAKPKQTIN